jgi:methylated-DNA-protein-cysteine methyltransferase-like protein
MIGDRPTSSLFQRIYDLVRQIPPGHVATYGQIATLAGTPHAARTVGWALASLRSDSEVPWHRVINARGEISLPRGEGYEVQRALLEAEGVEFDAQDRIDLRRYGWLPDEL